jgi:hydroxymethylpyrimidine pyrophosphatase-like HAD family hydrolase
MRRLADLPDAELSRLRGLLFDLDDTLLDHGQLLLPSYESLCNLAETGLTLVAVTGRPASFGQVLVRQWPIAGAVTENGIIAVSRVGRSVVTHDRNAERRPQLRQQLQALANEVRSRFGLVPTDDSLGRLADTTFDIGEAERVDPETVLAAAQFAEARGAHTIRSSVHLHLALEAEDKATGAVRFLDKVCGVDPSDAPFQFAFIGDSENDAACFAAFRTSVAVRNLRGWYSLPPRYITLGERGAGFRELAARLNAVRRR